jgi:hypothetical protein
MDLFELRTDPEREAGVPVTFVDEQLRLTLARSSYNEKYRAALERVLRDFKDRVGPVADAEREHATLIAFCRVCIVRWETLAVGPDLKSLLFELPEGITPDRDGYVPGIFWKGALRPYSPELAVEVFETRGLEPLREAVLTQARNVENFRNRQRKAETGN